MTWEVPWLNGDYVTHHNYILLKENLLTHESFCPVKTHLLKRHHRCCRHCHHYHQAYSRRGHCMEQSIQHSFKQRRILFSSPRWEQGWWNKMPLLKSWSGALRSLQLTHTSVNKPLAVILISFLLESFLWFLKNWNGESTFFITWLQPETSHYCLMAVIPEASADRKQTCKLHWWADKRQKFKKEKFLVLGKWILNMIS